MIGKNIFYGLLISLVLSSGCVDESRERACIDSGGSVGVLLCCRSTADFPNLCVVGACGCAPKHSHEVKTCVCGAGKCFDGKSCVRVESPLDEVCIAKSGESMGLTEAKEIALAGECGEQGALRDTYVCNTDSGSWWFDLDIDKEGCSPACVVSIESGTAEVDWRCVGASSCAGEGEHFSVVYRDKYPEQCCVGLTGWYSGMDTRTSIADVCYETGRAAGSPIGTCIDCGDGVCEDIENPCNCPGDCVGRNRSVFPSISDFCRSEDWSQTLSKACEGPLKDFPLCGLCTSPPSTFCAERGEPINYPAGINKDLPDVCCNGLEGLGAFLINESGGCERIKGGPFLTCMSCGNGVCESVNNFGENKCNCPEDCGVIDCIPEGKAQCDYKNGFELTCCGGWCPYPWYLLMNPVTVVLSFHAALSALIVGMGSVGLVKTSVIVLETVNNFSGGIATWSNGLIQ